MILKLKNAEKVIKEGFTAFVYNSKKEYPASNTVFVDCHDFHERVFVKESHRIYFVIEGGGTFDIGDETREVEKNDVVIIEPKVEYAYRGKMKLFEINFPATDANDEVKI